MTLAFVRDDDLGKPFAGLDRFHQMFVDRGIPIAYQVVPAFLTEEVAAWARTNAAAHPHLIELHQHGTHHEQTLDGEHAWSEFAGDRPIEEQRAVLTHGRDELARHLGDAFDPSVFTPPAHKYGPATVRVLESMGVQTLSAGVHTGPTARVAYTFGRLTGRVRLRGRTLSHHGRTLPNSPIREWSCAIDVDQDGRGARVTRTADELQSMFDTARQELDVVGVMFHHECYLDEAKFEAATMFLDTLVADPTVQFCSLGSLSERTTNAS